MKIHYPYHRTKLNGLTCGHPGGMVTCHIDDVTCGRCKRIMARRGFFGDFIFALATLPARYQRTFSR